MAQTRRLLTELRTLCTPRYSASKANLQEGCERKTLYAELNALHEAIDFYIIQNFFIKIWPDFCSTGFQFGHF